MNCRRKNCPDLKNLGFLKTKKSLNPSHQLYTNRTIFDSFVGIDFRKIVVIFGTTLAAMLLLR